jgi:hypothetical protein
MARIGGSQCKDRRESIAVGGPLRLGSYPPARPFHDCPFARLPGRFPIARLLVCPVVPIARLPGRSSGLAARSRKFEETLQVTEVPEEHD